MKPIVLTAEQRRQIERRRKGTLDRRIYQRLTAVLIVAEGKSREEVAHLLGIGLTQLGEWLPRPILATRDSTLYALFITRSDPGKLAASFRTQVDQLKEKVSTGCFRNSDQIRHWLQDTFGVSYSPTGMKAICSGGSWSSATTRVSGFLWKADSGQTARLRQADRTAPKREGETPAAAPRTRAATTSMRVIPFGAWTWCIAAGCWSASVCWWVWAQDAQAAEHPRRLLPRRPRIHRLPVDAGQHQRRTVRQLPAACWRSLHPQTERFILYVDGAVATTRSPVVKESGCDGIRSFTCRRSRHTPPTST